MKVVSVVGARPQFVKLAPVVVAMRDRGVDHVVVHTGQHYDANMSDDIFRDLGIPQPDVNLRIGSGSHGRQTGAMLAALDEVIEQQAPDWVLVYGDTNSTLAATLSAVKMHVPVAHLEAGLRSFNRSMPEEHNRVLTDHAADLLLAPTQTAMDHLRDEGLSDRSLLVGDVMADVCGRIAADLDPDAGTGDYLVATIHRAENTDDSQRLARVVAALQNLPLPVRLLAHPRLRDRCAQAEIVLEGGNLSVEDPVPYVPMMSLVAGSRGVVTDSGGLQKEAYLLGVPCTTLRSETEWTETLAGEWNLLNRDLVDLPNEVTRVIDAPRGMPYGDGHAADRTVAALLERSVNR